MYLGIRRGSTSVLLMVVLIIMDGVNASKLLAVGGYPPTAHFKFEAIDLVNPNSTCPKLPDFPGAAYGSIGAYLLDEITVCGGMGIDFDYSDKCFNYDTVEDKWSESISYMIAKRFGAAAVMLSPSLWWITGGHDGAKILNSTEVYDFETGVFEEYVELPEAKYLHNILKIDDTHFMLLGADERTLSNRTWMFDSEAETWTELPNMLITTRYPQAGLVIYNNASTGQQQQVVVVSGGKDTNATQLFSLADLKWSLGIEFSSVGLYWGSSVAIVDEEEASFMVVGGFSDRGGYRNEIEVMEGNAWVQLQQKLKIPRSRFAAFLVPAEIFSCVNP